MKFIVSLDFVVDEIVTIMLHFQIFDIYTDINIHTTNRLRTYFAIFDRIWQL